MQRVFLRVTETAMTDVTQEISKPDNHHAKRPRNLDPSNLTLQSKTGGLQGYM